MSGDAPKRVENWNDKYDTERIKAVLDRKRPAMLRHVVETFTELCSLEDQVKEVLNSAGVSTLDYVFYLDYGRQLWKLTRKKSITGPSFALAAQVLLEKWANRGLDPEVLAAIRSGIFSVSVP